MIETLVVCVTLLVSDGDTIKCNGQLMRLLGSGIPHVVGIDTPELRTWKCEKERKLAKLAKNRLKELMQHPGVRVMLSGEMDDTGKRPLVNIYLPDGREIGAMLLREGFAREWRKGKKNDWCD